MSKRNPCSYCIHYDCCGGTIQCNAFVPKSECSDHEQQRIHAERMRDAYREAYVEYTSEYGDRTWEGWEPPYDDDEE